MKGSKSYESAVLSLFGCALAIGIFWAFSNGSPEGGDELGSTVSVAQKLSSHPLIRKLFSDKE